MAKVRATAERPYPQPHGRDEWEYVRTAREGTYWQGSGGLVVRVAAAEHARDTTPAAAAREAERPAETMKAKKEIVRIARAWKLVFGR